MNAYRDSNRDLPRRGLHWKLIIVFGVALIAGLTIVGDQSGDSAPTLQDYAVKWNGWWMHLSQPYWDESANLTKPPKDSDKANSYSAVLGDASLKGIDPVPDPTNERADIMVNGVRMPAQEKPVSFHSGILDLIDPN